MRRVIRVLCALAGAWGLAFAGDPMPAVDLGMPITFPNRISYRTAREFGPSKLDLLCWTTTAESGGSFCAMEIASGRISCHPLNSLEAYPIVFGSDGMVYVGSTSGEVMRWDPRADTWGPLGAPLFRHPGTTVNHVRVLCEGGDGWLYAGSCYGERARLRMKDGSQERLPETPEKGNWYVSAAAALPDGRIAFGYGHKARVFVYDPVEKRDVAQLFPAGWTDDGFCFNLLAGETVLYATHFPSGRRAAFEIASGRFLGEVPWPPDVSGHPWSRWVHSSGYGSAVDFYLVPGADAIIACDGSAIHRYDPTRVPHSTIFQLTGFVAEPSLSLALRYEVTSDCRVLEYDAVRLKVMTSARPPQPEVERTVFSLGVGPDGKLYGGAYQSTLLFQHDPASHRSTVLGDHHPGWSGETFSYAVRGDELICASYTNGAVVAYAPARSWECERGAMVNPRLLGFYGQQVYRPFSTCVAQDGTIWSVGPAGWGSTGGGIGCIDPEKPSVEAFSVAEVPHSVLPLGDNRLLVCSDSLLRWWDTRAKVEVANVTIPFRCRDACVRGGGGREVAVLADTDRVLILDLSTSGRYQVTRSFTTPFSCSRILADGDRIVAGGSGGFVAIDLRTGRQDHFCSTPIGSRWACVVASGSLYFGSGGRLMRCALPTK